MPGETTTSGLADSLSTVRSAARTVREQKGGMRSTVDRLTLGKNIGNSWSEVDYAALTSRSVTESTDLIDSPEQLSDTLNTITPQDRGIHVLITDRVADRILSDGVAIIRSGILAMNAIMRGEDLDGIVQGRSASTDMGTAGQALVSNLIRHARTRISSNRTEPYGDGPIHGQFHGNCLADIEDELTAPMGTYPIAGGLTEDVITRGFAAAPRMIGKVFIHENGNLSIDSGDDSENFVYASAGIILVEGRGLRTEVVRRAFKGGGATSMVYYYEYAWGFRSSGNWQFSITADAANPS